MAAFPERAPSARVVNLVTTGSGDDVLVYDRLTHHIHHLNATAATVWQLCDGQHSVAELAFSAGTTEEVVWIALTKLADAKLLDRAVTPEVGGGPSSHSRRAFMKQAAIAGVAVPVIVSVSAPRAAA